MTLSYNLFKDPNVQFLRGYLTSLQAILVNDRTELTGLVLTWESLLNLYAHDGWAVTVDVVDKIKLFIRAAEKFSEPLPEKNYTGVFARFIITMACDLAQKGKLSNSDQKYFNQLRLKYSPADSTEWHKWRSRINTP